MDGNYTRAQWYAGLLWVIAAFALIIYGLIGFTFDGIPGVEELVDFLSSVTGSWILGAAFLSMFLEGLYFVGSFFPGSSLVAILAVFSQAGGTGVFLATIMSIFLGWCVAGIINVIFARFFHKKFVTHPDTAIGFKVKDRVLTTWFPAFRANYEVAQVAEGGNLREVFFSSVRVKFLVTLFLMLPVTFTIPYFIEIHEVSNDEGFLTIAIVAGISLAVGITKMCRRIDSQKTSEMTSK